MIDVLGTLSPLLITAVMLGGAWLWGKQRSKKLREALVAQEGRLAHIGVADVKVVPGQAPTSGVLVAGNAVVGVDYFRQWLGQWRNLFGGEMKSYAESLDFARRLARARMVEEAAQQGATMVINTRFMSSEIGIGKVEMYCYGTAVRV